MALNVGAMSPDSLPVGLRCPSVIVEAKVRKRARRAENDWSKRFEPGYLFLPSPHREQRSDARSGGAWFECS